MNFEHEPLPDVTSASTPEENINRFEVIDETGRVYVARPCRVRLDYQDKGKTLKIFVDKSKKGLPREVWE